GKGRPDEESFLFGGRLRTSLDVCIVPSQDVATDGKLLVQTIKQDHGFRFNDESKYHYGLATLWGPLAVCSLDPSNKEVMFDDFLNYAAKVGVIPANNSGEMLATIRAKLPVT
ncbi:MAG TPA: hypothetical protein VG965_00385, partial [Patescibacteria group bacterium]|nr:hypothetical protein [Patescibacteria group bacterium]